jgi:hypothetical protein
MAMAAAREEDAIDQGSKWLKSISHAFRQEIAVRERKAIHGRHGADR